jgi:hypothetical protein
LLARGRVVDPPGAGLAGELFTKEGYVLVADAERGDGRGASR